MIGGRVPGEFIVQPAAVVGKMVRDETCIRARRAGLKKPKPHGGRVGQAHMAVVLSVFKTAACGVQADGAQRCGAPCQKFIHLRIEPAGIVGVQKAAALPLD